MVVAAPAVAVKVSTVPTSRVNSGGRKAASGALPVAVDSRARATAFLPSAEATRGRTPSPAVTMTS